MITKRTVFIIGAGASCEVGFPSGVKLADQIITALTERAGNPQQFGLHPLMDPELSEYLHSRQLRTQRSPHTARQIILKGLPTALSIDEFLATHISSDEIVHIGKAAIARLILKAEAGSSLSTKPNTDAYTGPNLRQIGDKWHRLLLSAMASNVTTDQIELAFACTRFICFNYDRALEQVLIYGLASRFNVNPSKIIAILEKYPIIHPYGSIGPLPLHSAVSSVAFGSQNADLEGVLASLSVYTETDSQTLAAQKLAQDEIALAQRIVFLGFAYNRQNMDFLKPASSGPVTEIFGTAYGLGKAVVEGVKAELRQWGHPTTKINIEMGDRDQTCTEFFGEYYQLLTRP